MSTVIIRFAVVYFCILNDTYLEFTEFQDHSLSVTSEYDNINDIVWCW